MAAPVFNGNIRSFGEPVFNVKAYGAKGDGVTDDTAAINNAITAANAAGGGIVFLPAGTYYLGSGPLVPASNVWICGAGRDATVLKINGAQTGGNGDGIRIAITTPASYLNYVTISDLSVDCSATYNGVTPGQDQATYSNGMTLQGINYLLVERVRIYHPFGFGIILGYPGSPGYSGYNVSHTLRDIIVEGERNGNDAIGGGNIYDLRIENLYAHNCYGSGADITMISRGVYDGVYVVRDDASASSAYALGIGSDWGSEDVEYRNIFINGGLRGMSFGNEPGTGIPTFKNLTVSSVHITGVQHEGILFSNSTNNPFQNVILDKVTIAQWNGANATNYGVQVTDITGFRMHNCSVTNPQYAVSSVICTSPGGTAQGPSQAFITDNDFTGSGMTIASSLATTSVIVAARNLGFNPYGLLTPSVPASGTAFQNHYSVDVTAYISGGTVTDVSVGGSSTGMTSGAVRIPSGQSITLTYSAAPSWKWFGD